ncbi:MAG: trypsin-like peptidase domain-containing protein [Planctomycetaceae bacterium]
MLKSTTVTGNLLGEPSRAGAFIRSSRRLTAGVLLAIFAMFWSVSQSYGEFVPAEFESRIQQVVAKSRPAVVAIVEAGRPVDGAFSGVIVSAEGHILSAAHAVAPGQRYDLFLADGRRLRGVGKGVNHAIDCALIRVTDAIPTDKPLPFAEMGQSQSVVKGHPCVSISHPGGFNRERGSVVRFGRIVQPLTQMFGMMESTALMEPGDSGGPLFDFDGKVIAIHSRIEAELDANYDIPIDSFRLYWNELNEQKAFDVPRIPGMPIIGFSGRRDRELGGILVNDVIAGSAAAEAGLQDGDVVRKAQGAIIRNPQAIVNIAFSLLLDGRKDMELVVLRDGTEQKIRLPLRASETAVDDVTPSRQWLAPELSNLPRQFATLESRLDDVSVFVVSRRGRNRLRAIGLLLSEPGYIVTKSSQVDANPVATLSNGRQVPVTVVARDDVSDLVLLHTSETVPVGLAVIDQTDASKQVTIPGKGDFNAGATPPVIKLGSFLISPSPDGPGWVSVLSSPPFRSERIQSRGYFGVVLKGNDGKVTIGELIPGGPADKAGLRFADQVLQFDDVKVNKTTDVYNFLRRHAPGDQVELTVQREGEAAPLQLTLELGEPPLDSDHIAEEFEGGKSTRRDGFATVFCHDARLTPEDCGGPLFDQQGEFIGLNIARHSRTQSYFLPRTIVADFVHKSLPAHKSTAN